MARCKSKETTKMPATSPGPATKKNNTPAGQPAKRKSGSPRWTAATQSQERNASAIWQWRDARN
jgi:hypothetical protein